MLYIDLVSPHLLAWPVECIVGVGGGGRGYGFGHPKILKNNNDSFALSTVPDGELLLISSIESCFKTKVVDMPLETNK